MRSPSSNPSVAIHWVTPRLAGGAFPRDRAPELVKAGITHVLNVSSTAPKHYGDAGGLTHVVWRPINDLSVIPTDVALACIDDIHAMLSRPRTRVYVHCLAGQNRSPTIVWLYLVARGFTAEEARKKIELAWPGSMPAHPQLIDSDLVATVRSHFKRLSNKRL